MDNFNNNNQYNGPKKDIVGQLTAAQLGMQFGQAIEVTVEQSMSKKGQPFRTFLFSKPYQKKDGTMGNGFSFMLNSQTIKELVERINWLIAHFGSEKGVFVFQPMPQQNIPIPQFGANLNTQPAPGGFNPANHPAPNNFGGSPAVNNGYSQPQPTQQPVAQNNGFNPNPGKPTW